MTRVLVGVVLFAAFAAVLVTSLMREANVKCEVCVEFNGRRACRTNFGANRDRAIYGATSAACVVLASGVTAGIQCGNTPPRSVRCDE